MLILEPLAEKACGCAERIIFQGTLGSWVKATGLAAAAQCSLSWGQRCYVNWLLFGKWGRSPSYEQNAPHCHALAPFQDVFHLHSWFGCAHWTNPSNSWLHLWFEWSKWCIEWHILAMSPCRKINSWKMLPECRFVGYVDLGGGWGGLCVLCVSMNYSGLLSYHVPLLVVMHSPGAVLQNYSFLSIFFKILLRNIQICWN